ncbi:MAG: ABC transporter permease [Caldilineaceae bacterium]
MAAFLYPCCWRYRFHAATAVGWTAYHCAGADFSSTILVLWTLSDLDFCGHLPNTAFRRHGLAPPPSDLLHYTLSLLKHPILPVSAIVLSAIFLSIYSWRTFFLIYSSEDYVEMAHAKGLSSGTIERRYILRPTLPTIVTNFALTLISLWTGAIVLETVFNWPGLGRLLYQAVNVYDTPVIVGSVVIYAYLLAITVFLLDIIYALLDPRVKVGEGSKTA